MQRLLAGELDEGGYGKLLEAQLALLGDWEERCGWWLTSHVADAGWRYVSRAHRLAADVGSVWEPLQRRWVLATSLPATAGSPAIAGSHKAAASSDGAALMHEAWGELYVIEGSALGGRVIVKHLRERFPALPHHFYAIGENADEPWPRFQSVLDRALAEPAALRAAVDGALRMFARFQQTLQDDAAHV